MFKLIITIFLVILLLGSLIITPKNTLIFIKEVSIKTIDLVQTIYEKGKPIITDIKEKTNNTNLLNSEINSDTTLQ